MTQTIMICIACAIGLLSAAVAYQYLSHRVDGKCQMQQFFRLRFELYPLLTVAVGLLAAVFVFVFCLVRQGDSFMRALMNGEVMLWLFVVGYIDLRERIIPNSMIGLALLGWVALISLEIFLGGTPWNKLLVFSAIGGLACGGALMVIALIMKSGLGMGDVKLFFVLGLLYGLMDTYGIFLFTMIPMGLFAIGLLLLKKASRKSTIPMAPFVVIGFFLSIIAGM